MSASNNSNIRDNHTRGPAAEFLRRTLTPGCTLSIVSAYFTIYAYEKLKATLDLAERTRFLFGDPKSAEALDPGMVQSKAYSITDTGLSLLNTLERKRAPGSSRDTGKFDFGLLRGSGGGDVATGAQISGHIPDAGYYPVEGDKVIPTCTRPGCIAALTTLSALAAIPIAPPAYARAQSRIHGHGHGRPAPQQDDESGSSQSIMVMPEYRRAESLAQKKDWRGAIAILQKLSERKGLSGEQSAFILNQIAICRGEIDPHRAAKRAAHPAATGPASLLIICRGSGIKTNLAALVKSSHTVNDVTSPAGIKLAANSLGLKFEAWQADRVYDLPELRTPCIVWIRKTQFYVVRRFTGRGAAGTAVIRDPNSSQDSFISQAELFRISNGIFLVIHR